MNKAYALVIIAVLLFAGGIIPILFDATDSWDDKINSEDYTNNSEDLEIGLEVIGENKKFIKPGESAHYMIEVENRGKGNKEIKLETFGTPVGWKAELNKNEASLDAGESEDVFLTVSSPSGTRAAPVANVEVRASTEGKTGTKNEKLVKTVTWSFNYDYITETIGDYENPTRIETSVDGAVVFELLDTITITVKHIDQSGDDEYNGTEFYRNITMSIDVTFIISPETILEIGYLGSFDYENRDSDGNPIQDRLELKGNITKGTVYFIVKPGGGRASAENPLIDIFSKEGDTAVGSVAFSIPSETTTSLIFSVGVTEETTEIEVFEGILDVQNKKVEETGEVIVATQTIEVAKDSAPQGISIENVEEDAAASPISKDVVNNYWRY